MAKRVVNNRLCNVIPSVQLILLICFISCIGISETARHRRLSRQAFTQSSDRGEVSVSVVNFPRSDRRKRSAHDDHLAGEPRLKRSASDGVDPKNRTTVYQLRDSHSTLVVHWEGKGSDVIIALAKNPVADSTSLYFSSNYGKSFEKVDDKLKVDESTHAIIHKYYNSTDDYIFTDVVNSCLFITRDGGATFERVCNLPFKPVKLSINPYNHRRLLGTDPDSGPKELYISEDFGKTWEFLYSGVKDFYWGIYPHDGSDYQDIVYIHEATHGKKGQFIKAKIRRAQPPVLTPMAQDVVKATVDGSYIYLVKSVVLLGSNHNPHLQLWVSYDRGDLRNAQFPINFEDSKITEIHVVDASEGQVMVCVSVNSSFTNLYISEVKGHRFTLSLEKIVYFNPESTNNQSWVRFYTNDTFADITRIAGVPGVYVASKQIKNTLDFYSQRTLITFDKGGSWDVIEPPERVLSLHPDACETLTNCSLHLTQEFSRIYPLSGSTPILSMESAPGLIIASGMLGETLKAEADVFVSSDAGLTWDQALSGSYDYAMGDHGGILVAVEVETPTNEIMYSIDEGQTWHSYRFVRDKINVYGLLTEPGEKSSVFSVFGSSLDAHSWRVIQIDFKNAFENKDCTTDDYKWWSFGESQKDKNWCLLGRFTKYQRRVRHTICFNGRDFVRQKTVENCSCTMEDFECDFGYEETLYMKTCMAIEGFDTNQLHQIPDPCPEGTFYPYSRGYRKVAGDTCQGGEEHKLGPLMYSCPIRDREDFLLVNKGGATARINLADGTVLDVPHGFSRNVAKLVAFDYQEDCEIYLLEDTRSIKRMCIPGDATEKQSVYSAIREYKESTHLDCLAFDWTSRNIFSCNRSDSTIFVVDIQFNDHHPFQRTLYGASNGLKNPVSLIVDPVHGYMFFVNDIGESGGRGIFRAAMDGSDAKVTLVANATFVTSANTVLTLDSDTEELFWVTHDRLVKSDFFGKNISVLCISRYHLDYTVGIGLYKDQFYIAKLNDERIFVANRHNPCMFSTFPIQGSIDNIKGLMVVSGISQRAMSACSDFHNQCSQLCLPRPNSPSVPHTGPHNRTCLCGEGYRIRRQDNGRDEACSCEPGETMGELGYCERNTNVTTCSPDQFQCASSDQCIYATWLCDGDHDCSDGSDEMDCALKSCDASMFTCANGKCILASWHCDREDDCRDGKATDEIGCGKQNCTSTQFQCADGYCIHYTWKCDGDNDCHDFSDEQDCGLNVTSCSPWEFLCNDGTCIGKTYRCNGVRDCPDASDESECDPQTNSTTSVCDPIWSVPCESDGQCINRAWVCDGMNDCDDGSDEKNCDRRFTTTTTPHTTPYNSCNQRGGGFRCPEGFCIPLVYVCNGIDDCGDHYDEEACERSSTPRPSRTTSRPGDVTCGAHEYQCERNASTTGFNCLWRAWMCDGDEDCPLGDDERDCDKDCPNPSFYCLFDGNCIPKSKVCDGHYDCQDRTDEQGCPTFTTQNPSHPTGVPPSNYTCPTDYLPCNDYRRSCFPFTRGCDRVNDCRYNSHDEDGCDKCNSLNHVVFTTAYHPQCSDCAAAVWIEWHNDSLKVSWNKYSTFHLDLMFAYSQYRPEDSDSNKKKETPLTFTKQDMNTVRGNVKLNQLLPGTRYKLEFLTKLVDGTQCNLGWAIETTLDGLPDVPRNVVVRARGNKDNPYIVLLWQKPLHFYKGILSYVIFYQEMSDDLKQPIGNVVRVIIEDFSFNKRKALSNDTEHDYQFPLEGYFEWNKHYSIQMAAKSIIGMSPFTEKKTFFMTETKDDSHSVQMKVSVTVVNDTAVRVTWKADPLAVKYTVVGLSMGGQERVTVSVATDATEAVVGDLCPGTTFEFSVHVSHGASAETVHTAKPVTLPSTTTSTNSSTGTSSSKPVAHKVTVEMTGPTSVMVAFATPDSQKGSPNFIYYTKHGLSYQDKTTLVQPQRITLPAHWQTQREIKGLDACERYWLAVVPSHPTCQGYGVQTFVTLEDEKAPPKNVRAKIMHQDDNKAPVSLKLSWDASCYVVSRPLNYVLRVKTGSKPYQSFTTAKPSNATKLTFDLQQVIPGENYTLTVRSSVVGARECSPIHVHIPEEFTPWHLHVARVEEKEVVLEWKWDSSTVPEFQMYRVTYKLVDDDSTTGDATENRTKSSHIRLTLPAVGIYRFKVSALAYDGVEVSSTRLQYDLYSSEVNKPHGGGGGGGGDGTAVSLSKTNLVAIIVPVSAVVVLLSAGIVFFIVRHRRLQRSFLAFANSHYNIQSGTTTFSEELDGDEPLIQGFSDDEPLVIG